MRQQRQRRFRSHNDKRCDNAVACRSYQDRVGGGEGGEPCRGLRRGAGNGITSAAFAQALCDQRPGIDSGLEDHAALLTGESGGTDGSDAGVHFQRRSYRAQFVVFMRRRHAEQGDHFLSVRVVHEAAMPSHGLADHLAHSRDDFLEIARVERFDHLVMLRDGRDKDDRPAAFGGRWKC